MTTAQDQFVDFIFRNYIDKGKKYLGIALDRDSDVYRIPYFALAKTPGALKTLFKRSRYDMKDLTIYELVESVDLSGADLTYWQEIYPIDCKGSGTAFDAFEFVGDLVNTPSFAVRKTR